jgi:hypothetical protein
MSRPDIATKFELLHKLVWPILQREAHVDITIQTIHSLLETHLRWSGIRRHIDEANKERVKVLAGAFATLVHEFQSIIDRDQTIGNKREDNERTIHTHIHWFEIGWRECYNKFFDDVKTIVGQIDARMVQKIDESVRWFSESAAPVIDVVFKKYMLSV